MADLKNVVLLFNNTLYKEIDIDSYESNELLFGNFDTADIYIKLDVNLKFSFKLLKNNDYWEISDGENVYFLINSIKVNRKKLVHGDQISVKLTSNKLELFKINFFIDFSSGKENYDKIVYFENKDKISIGSDDSNDICITDKLVDKHHCSIKLSNGIYTLTDENSRYSVYINGKKVNSIAKLSINDFIIICGYKFLFMGDRLLINNYSNMIIINGLKVGLNKAAKTSLQYPEFIRNARYMYNLPEEKVKLIAPPKKDKKPSFEMFLSVIPTIGMMILALSLRGGGTSSIYYVGMVVIMLISTTLMFVIRYRKTNQKLKERNKNYISYMNKQEKKIANLYNEQRRISNILSPNIEESIDIVNSFNNRLWEKDLNDDDFLSITLGKGTVGTSFEVEIPEEKWGETEDDLILMPRKIKEKYESLDDMPINVNLYEEKGVAIVGEKRFLNEFIKSIIIQIVTFQYYEDVKIALVCPDEDRKYWDWMRWLPHVWSDDKKVRFLGLGETASHNIMSVLAKYLEAYKEAASSSGSKKVKSKPHFVFIVTDPELLQQEKVSKYLDDVDCEGCTPIYLYEQFEKTPKNCTALVKLKSSEDGELIHFSNAEKITEFKYSLASLKDYESFARRIAPIYVRKSYTDNSLPKSITFYDLYKVNSSREIPILRSWNNNAVYKHIKAPLGVDTAGNIISLDLHEKYHGPHGLVAGTTGSGKSELLQTLIASLAINYHPHEINFILIDYKGGGMANLFEKLPHLVGTITNLDGRGINRSLVAIKSELKRRQMIFKKAEVNHIDSYIKLYKDGKVSEAIPHLIIIADEFAELKRDQPEFMQELVSTARIGRSLGVHLILATQKPSGVVNNQIWSNSKFKLCLKVQDASDSKEVIKSDLAANIVEPGRAYLQVGNNEIFELFQSAWSGAKVYEDDNLSKNDIEISKVSIEGIREVIYSSANKDEDRPFITQLDDVINTVAYVCRKNGINRLPGPWLPELKKLIYLEDLLIQSEEDTSDNITCKVGFIDDPEGQKQYPLELDLTQRGNILIIGGSGYGKTTFIQTVIMSLARKYSPKEVNMYILDFGTRVLKTYEELPHVGGVVLKDDEEKLVRLIRLLRKEIENRKNLFSKVGAVSLKSYKEATGAELPQIVVLIDNFIGLKEMYDSMEDEIGFIAREGLTLGISTIVATNAYGNIRYKIISNFNDFFAFTCQDNSEYSSMFGSYKVSPSDVKGRVLCKYDRIMEAQICMPIKQDNYLEGVRKLKEFIKESNEKFDNRAKKIPSMPAILNRAYFNSFNLKSNVVPLGISYEDIEEEFVDLNENQFVIVTGAEKSGKSNFLKCVAANLEGENSITYIIDSSKRALRNTSEMNNVKYLNTPNDVEAALDEIRTELENRSEVMKEKLFANDDKFDAYTEFKKLTVIIDNVKDFVSYCSKEYIQVINDLMVKYKDVNVSLFICGVDSEIKDLQFAQPFIKKIKEYQYGICFGDLENQKIFDVFLKYGRKKEKLSIGDGFLIKKGKFKLIKTPNFD